MGTTVRRQPVNFDIPKSPDYKFLNVTNFRGLDVSSNPFELPNNTASDCLNVYVDETNTLTTRPRIEKKINAPLAGEHIGTYNLHNGYLLHYIKDGVGILAIWRNDELTFITGQDLTPNETDTTKKEFLELPTTKCEYFEQDDEIYLLDGTRYLVIHENVLREVVGYVPTTSVINAVGERSVVEPMNLLSDKYDEEYVWDGVSVESLPKNTMNVENTYYTEKHELPGELICLFSDNSAITWSDDLTYYYIPDILADDLEKYAIANYRDFSMESWMVSVGGTDDGATKVFCVLDAYAKYYYTYVRQYDNYWIKTQYEIPAWENTVGSFDESLTVKNNGDLFCVNHYESGQQTSSRHAVSIFVKNVKSQQFERCSILYGAFLSGDGVSDTNEVVVMQYNSLQHIKITQTVADYSATISVKQTEIANYSNKDAFTSGIFPDGSVVWVGGRTWLDIYNNTDGKFSSENYIRRRFPTGVFIQRIGFNYTEGSAWGSDLHEYSVFYTPSYISRDFENTYVPAYPMKYFARQYYLSPYGDFVYIWNPEGKIIDHRTLLDDTDWLEKRTRLFKSTIATRFDNNYWLAHNNRYYRSRNNDPTYFPETEFNDLGDSNEPITGFNLANDTTLLAYKTNRVYLIQPMEASTGREYSITESKNTVGNTAINAPIVTTLTEIPLQINSDGIYGLSQLQNVSAVERIADLMSEPINEKWLREDDEVIKNTLTINRLYWTYIILPYADYTKVYLLDNRTNSWYYWELPIVISNAFVKDNVTEFVNLQGDIYYLTTEDVKNPAFLPLVVTEYYDYGRKLIPWYWQSQILHLGTMNYSKRLVNTTFIMTDTDTQDGYGLQYNYKVFRKMASNTPEKEISDELNLVRSTTKKTNISKFGFIQLKLSNITEESQGTDPEKAYRNNKLRLVGLGLKYVLLEGLIR